MQKKTLARAVGAPYNLGNALYEKRRIYVRIPGGIEAIMRSLREFAKLRFELGRSVGGG